MSETFCCKGFYTVLENLTTGYITSLATAVTIFLVTCVICLGSKFGLCRNPAVADEKSETSVGDTLMAGPSSSATGEMDITELQESDTKYLLAEACGNQQIIKRTPNFNIKEAEKIIEAGMTEEQKIQEKLIQQKQIVQIFEMLKNQPEKFGTTTIDDVQEQLKLYH